MIVAAMTSNHDMLSGTAYGAPYSGLDCDLRTYCRNNGMLQLLNIYWVESILRQFGGDLETASEYLIYSMTHSEYWRVTGPDCIKLAVLVKAVREIGQWNVTIGEVGK